MRTIRAILIGVAIWILGVTAYIVSFNLSILKDRELQADIVLFLSVIPLVWFGSALYYKNDKTILGYKLGQTFLLVSIALDALITVPFFMKPVGIDHLTFFTSFSFCLVAFEFISVAALYYYIKVYLRTIKVNQ
ncbi:MAG: hypothetical protein ED556_10570 [Winogradskyella sp.]|uniref:DUF5367 family protein n=1 Tax=Winogradskyella sp. TaxID=1883156 RepID=UPI000F3C0A5A|nr:DUF5367 family protein [Winogradskyella sp.]RNC85005.1 MAG: hypothetical protein ED556_10570 [Winogradskyella sp.]